jgi:hypothetical protein
VKLSRLQPSSRDTGETPDLGEAFARGGPNAARPSVEAVIDQGKEVTEMLSRTNLRQLLATGLALGVLAAVTPATGLASNPGGGGHPIGKGR